MKPPGAAYLVTSRRQGGIYKEALCATFFQKGPKNYEKYNIGSQHTNHGYPLVEFCFGTRAVINRLKIINPVTQRPNGCQHQQVIPGPTYSAFGQCLWNDTQETPVHIDKSSMPVVRKYSGTITLIKTSLFIK